MSVAGILSVVLVNMTSNVNAAIPLTDSTVSVKREIC